MFRFNFTTFLIFLLLALPVNGKDKSTIFTVDMNKLLKLSNIGKDIVYRNNLARISLQNENDALEAELLMEEKTLSDLRKELSANDFRAKAIEFDEKVTIIRSEQSKKEDTLVNNIRKEEAEFYKSIYPLLYELLSDRGGLVLMDQRNIILWDSSVDITEDAIVVINKVLGKSDQNTKDVVE